VYPSQNIPRLQFHFVKTTVYAELMEIAPKKGREVNSPVRNGFATPVRKILFYLIPLGLFFMDPKNVLFTGELPAPDADDPPGPQGDQGD
jgi:hypothetical protein